METYQLLFVCALLVFIVMTLCSLIPVCIVAKKSTEASKSNLSSTTRRIMSFCNSMAGGVFIGVCFLGLVPYARDKTLACLELLHVKTDFPVAESIMVLGFFLIMATEKILPRCKKFRAQEDAVCTDTQTIRQSNASQVQSIKSSQYFGSDDDESAVNLLTDPNSMELVSPESPSISFCSPNQKTTQNIYENLPPTFPQNLASQERGKIVKGCSKHLDEAFERPEGLLRLAMLYVAIGIHSLFEGMALGLQTERMRIFHLFFAILFHEALVSFSIGITLARHNMSLKRSLKYVLLFTVSVPFGVVLGIVIQQAPGVGGSVASAILQCISAGIFIHVTFVELVPAEFADDRDVMSKVVFHFLGFLALALVTAVMGSHH